MCGIVNCNINGIVKTFPVIYGSLNEKAINISTLREQTGYITFDPGFKNTSIAKSSISFVDGEKGILLYRGYPIEEIIQKCTFLKTSYLLLNGELPNEKQLHNFSYMINQVNISNNNTKILQIFEKYPINTHPMGILSSLSSILEFMQEENNNNIFIHLLAKFPILAALIYRKKHGLSPVNYDNTLYYTSNIVNMFFATNNDKPNYIIVDALDKLLILHADHEQNCSTTTVRLLSSAHVSLYASIAAGISALWGRLHGGANEAVIEMLENILHNGGNIKKWIEKAKNKKDPFRLMGFGHRIYKNFDPRAIIIKQVAENIMKKLKFNNPILQLAKELEEVAINDSYFIEKKLYPNIDFYSGIIYQAIGIPKDMFTVMFALGRLPGWIAHWKEMRLNQEPLVRPRQIYVGYKKRNIL
ncbi:citrate synthase [Blattabacterium cuenoti]|uniref:citrate synthase n=1 Tax=Blattabacterium cuenoti TaxID=1653831 RepID=UPI00163D3399|nr:citrate synthase [Blattabacterium cuenoti]